MARQTTTRVSRLALNLLGYPEVQLDGLDLGDDLVRYQKAFSLLVYLVMTGQPQSRLHLAELLWPELDEQKGLAYLRGRAGLTQLRAHLDPFLLIDRQSVAFRRDAAYTLDVEQFQALLRGQASLEQLETAANLYRDDFCSGFLPEGVSPEFEMWLYRWREQLRQQQMSALEQLVAGFSRWREYERALHFAERLLRMDPWLEGTHRWIMSLYAWQGQTGRATAQYELCRELLQAELGVEPAAETQQLYREVLQGTLAAPRPIPFLAPGLPPHFVHREEVLSALMDDLQPGAAIAVVGMGGTGKTTLAAQLAREARHRFPDGILWASPELSPGEEILHTWSKFYDFDLRGLTTLEAMQTAWRGIAAGRRMLVVLDGAVLPERIRPLLPHSPGSAVLMTTRNHELAASLNAGSFELDPFDLPAGRRLVEAILGPRAVEDSETVSAICDLLEGLPLALEIISQRLRSRPQQTLAETLARLQRIHSRLELLEVGDRAVRASFELSWQTLEPALQSLFAALALFAGRPFHPEAVAALTGDADASWRLADLAALSLVQDAGGDYCRQHALLADFAREKLDALALDEAGLERRLVSYYAGFVADHHSDYRSLTQEWGNIQEALAAAHRHEDWQRVYDIGRQMTDAWFLRARFSLAREAYQLCYDAARRLGQDAELAQTLFDWGRACMEQGDYAEAQRHLEESRRLFVENAGEAIRAADVNVLLGRLAVELSQFGYAEKCLAEAQRVFEQARDWKRLARVHFRSATLAYRGNNFERAKELSERAVEYADGEYLFLALNLLADIHMKQEQLDMAEEYLAKMQALCEQRQDKTYMAVVDSKLGRLYRRRGSFDRAVVYTTRSLEQARQMGDRKNEAYALYDLSLIAEQQADYGRGIDLANQCLDIFSQLGDTFNVMNTFVHLGDLFSAQRKDVQAKSCWHRSLALAESLGNERFIEGLQRRLQQLR